MEKLFGEYLIKCKVLEPPAATEEEKIDAVDPDAHADEVSFYPYQKVSVEEAMVRTQTAHVAVLFTAEYCPPCQGFM